MWNARRAYGWPVPQFKEDSAFKAKLAHFAGTPVTLAAPLVRGIGYVYLIKHGPGDVRMYGPRSSAKSLLHALEVAAASAW